MVLTESMKMAAFTGNAAEVTAFLEKNPEGVDDVDEHAPDALAKVLPRPAEGAPAPPISPGAQTRQGQAGDAATPRAPLRAEPAERDRVARARVLEPSPLALGRVRKPIERILC